MSLINTGVNYPVERGGSGKFKALSTTLASVTPLSAAAHITITPAKGNAILLFGLINVSTGIPATSVAGSLYGNIVENKNLSSTIFYISQNLSSGTVSSAVVSGVPAIQFETDEVVTISTATVASNNVYLSYQEGYIL